MINFSRVIGPWTVTDITWRVLLSRANIGNETASVAQNHTAFELIADSKSLMIAPRNSVICLIFKSKSMYSRIIMLRPGFRWLKKTHEMVYEMTEWQEIFSINRFQMTQWLRLTGNNVSFALFLQAKRSWQPTARINQVISLFLDDMLFLCHVQSLGSINKYQICSSTHL